MMARREEPEEDVWIGVSDDFHSLAAFAAEAGHTHTHAHTIIRLIHFTSSLGMIVRMAEKKFSF